MSLLFLRFFCNRYYERRLDQHDFIYDPIVDIDIFGGVYGICRERRRCHLHHHIWRCHRVCILNYLDAETPHEIKKSERSIIDFSLFCCV